MAQKPISPSHWREAFQRIVGLFKPDYQQTRTLHEIFTRLESEERKERDRVVALECELAGKVLQQENTQLRSEVVEVRDLLRLSDEEREAERQRRRFDFLTGAVEARSYVEDILPFRIQEICVTRGHEWPTLGAFDVRELKLHNDFSGYGHDFGTALLKGVGAVVRGTIRHPDLPLHGDVFARPYGTASDEFHILFPHPHTAQEAFLAASRVKDAVAQQEDWSEFHSALNEAQWRPIIDLGAASVEGLSLRKAFKQCVSKAEKDRFVQEVIDKWRPLADLAMYDAKHSRSDHVTFRRYRWQDREFVEVLGPIILVEPKRGE